MKVLVKKSVKEECIDNDKKAREFPLPSLTDENIKVDGTMGTSSIIAINNMDEEQLKLLNNSINDKRSRYFEEQNSPRFKRGLLNRNKRLRW